jgi:hypothetical protein
MTLRWIALSGRRWPRIRSSAGRIPTGVAYEIALDDSVAAQVSGFSAPTRHYWNVCLAQIRSDPFPRRGSYVERVIAIAPSPLRVRYFEITEETSISGEKMFVLVADFFPGRSLVYVLHKYADYEAQAEACGGEARIFYVRPYAKRIF